MQAAGLLALVWLLSITFSIAVAEAALWLSAAAWGIAWLFGELGDQRPLDAADGPSGPAGDALGLLAAPVIAFFAVSLLSATLSRAPVDSVFELREVFLFAAPLVTWAVFRTPSARDRGREVFAVGILVAVAVGIGQTYAATMSEGAAPLRATGPLGHYMTFSGVLLVAVPLLLTIRPGFKTLLAHVVAVLAVGMIVLTLTRSAWIGCAVALATYLATGFVSGGERATEPSRVRSSIYGMGVAIAVIVILVLLAALVEPDALYERAASVFSLDDPSNVDRLAMAATGLRLIRAYPLLGVGPGLMEQVYPAWVVDWAVLDANPHLHNNVLQIAAERGLLGLAAWLWTVAAFYVVAWRVLRAAGPKGEGGPESRAALAALSGFLVMGLFEYNFSDSEVLMALLYVISLPLAASAGLGGRRRHRPAA